MWLLLKILGLVAAAVIIIAILSDDRCPEVDVADGYKDKP